MTSAFSADDYIEARELEDYYMVTAATIYYHTRKLGDWRFIMSARTGRNAPRKLILIADLPRALQRDITQRGKGAKTQSEEPKEKETNLAQSLLRFPTDERSAWQAELVKLANLIERYVAISPKRVRDVAGQYQPSPAVAALLEEAACTDPVILKREPSRGNAVSIKTLDAWKVRYREHGLVAFLRSTSKAERSDDRRKAAMSPEAIEWVNANWRKYRNVAHLYRALQAKAKRERWGNLPSKAWFERRWKELPQIVLTSHLEGTSAYTDKWAPYIPRTVADLEALQVLVGDHSQRDVVVLLKDGRTLARPWLTLWQCTRTGLLWGWHLDLVPSSYTIGAAYANGVKTYGAQPISRPDEGFFSYIYTDRGRDYRSHHLDGSITVHKAAANLTGGIEVLCVQRGVGLLKDLDIKHILARGYNAREKQIERVHRDISLAEENTFDEWCGSNTVSRPERYRRLYAQHQKFLAGKREASPFIGFDEYREWLAGWIRVAYNASPHKRTTLNNASIVPLDEFQRLYTTRYTISDQALALLLMKAERRVVRKLGVELFNLHYLHPEMALWKGREVEVRYDDADYSTVWVILPDGKICQAEMVERSSLINHNKETFARLKKQAAYENKVRHEHALLSFSMARGETIADRVAQQEQQEEEEVEAIAAAGGGSIHKLTRFDGPKLRAVNRAPIVGSLQADDSIFGMDTTPRGRVREFDYED